MEILREAVLKNLKRAQSNSELRDNFPALVRRARIANCIDRMRQGEKVEDLLLELDFEDESQQVDFIVGLDAAMKFEGKQSADGK